MKTIKKMFAFKDFYKDLIEKYGINKADEIWSFAEEEYCKMIEAEPNADSASLQFAFPAVALYRAVEKYSPNDALTVTRNYGTKAGLKFKGIFKKITSIPGVPAFMWRHMDKISAKMSDGYDICNLQVTQDKCFMDVIRCPLYDKAVELGTPEAVQMICCMDKEYMTGFRGIDYERTKSVAEGDDCCDYRLRRASW